MPICGETAKCQFSDCKPKVECVVVGLCGSGLLFGIDSNPACSDIFRHVLLYASPVCHLF